MDGRSLVRFLSEEGSQMLSIRHRQPTDPRLRLITVEDQRPDSAGKRLAYVAPRKVP